MKQLIAFTLVKYEWRMILGLLRLCCCVCLLSINALRTGLHIYGSFFFFFLKSPNAKVHVNSLQNLSRVIRSKS